jgi:hypothetical protein
MATLGTYRGFKSSDLHHVSYLIGPFRYYRNGYDP